MKGDLLNLQYVAKTQSKPFIFNISLNFVMCKNVDSCSIYIARNLHKVVCILISISPNVGISVCLYSHNMYY